MTLRALIWFILASCLPQPVRAETEISLNLFECASSVSPEYHLWFCDLVRKPKIHGAPRVLKAFTAELAPSFQPAHRVLLYETERGWILQAHIYKTEQNYKDDRSFHAMDSRTVFTDVGTEIAIATVQKLNEHGLAKPKASSQSSLCLDGSHLIVRTLTDEGRHLSVRHNCEGRTDLDRFAEVLLELLSSVDPMMDPYTEGFTLPETAK